ncbi:hypothetical protein PSN45_002957 [Yamadazyma tenuis]|uniref:Uncharacterized protein n=1 Tax=Candida tenuis (strain ATCC 10573 / BCRC 21748 / CBS 615 / JCM 9827 / NBRC 10315 / NRRL Y-1498 / VKM Y-70) TaxID=590646 RepID=G3AW38_CANTC|nr:uncharacterized protein CANTEDRAFT_112177 [Yamadazyma tenuis ATCC 10573]EGV66442.1 hypothetical protein CANTEDRAFT_112177 [Yamadazyma tenuis ATCC 10573]WEJ95438.1 hypothetical protein PSN45_002957 [Yamadazyma tenuis]
MGFLNFVTLVTTVIYPVIASYRAYEQYKDANHKFNGSNLSIGGFNVPINTLFKKATGDHDETVPNEAALLLYESNRLQKWYVYWIVHTVVELIDSGLYLKYLIPFHSLFKLGISVWLLSPMLQYRSIDAFDAKTDLNSFFEGGCGFCYKKFVSPLLQGEVKFLSDISLKDIPFNTEQLPTFVKSILDYVKKLMEAAPSVSLLNFIRGSARGVDINESGSTTSFSAASGAEYLGSLRSFSASTLQGYFSKVTSDPSATSKDTVEDEYDVIDSPSQTDGVGASPRTTQTDPVKRKGWIW